MGLYDPIFLFWESISKMVEEKFIQELKQFIKNECDKDVSLQEASEIANGLVGWYDLLAKIYHRTKTNG